MTCNPVLFTRERVSVEIMINNSVDELLFIVLFTIVVYITRIYKQLTLHKKFDKSRYSSSTYV